MSERRTVGTGLTFGDVRTALMETDRPLKEQAQAERKNVLKWIKYE